MELNLVHGLANITLLRIRFCFLSWILIFPSQIPDLGFKEESDPGSRSATKNLSIYSLKTITKLSKILLIPEPGFISIPKTFFFLTTYLLALQAGLQFLGFFLLYTWHHMINEIRHYERKWKVRFFADQKKYREDFRILFLLHSSDQGPARAVSSA